MQGCSSGGRRIFPGKALKGERVKECVLGAENKHDKQYKNESEKHTQRKGKWLGEEAARVQCRARGGR